MKVRISITVTQELRDKMDRLPGNYSNRSAFLEAAAWAFITNLRRAEQSERDGEIFDRRADYLNGEVTDAWTHQTPL